MLRRPQPALGHPWVGAEGLVGGSEQQQGAGAGGTPGMGAQHLGWGLAAAVPIVRPPSSGRMNRRAPLTTRKPLAYVCFKGEIK